VPGLDRVVAACCTASRTDDGDLEARIANRRATASGRDDQLAERLESGWALARAGVTPARPAASRWLERLHTVPPMSESLTVTIVYEQGDEGWLVASVPEARLARKICADLGIPPPTGPR
jgi:hypothetical protein